MYRFRLYVAGEAPNSLRARANLAAFCKRYLPERHEIEIVDVLRDPQRALAESIFMTPTLVTLEPTPLRRIVGSLGQSETLLFALGLDAAAA